jgi:hypothetical protein
MGLGGGKKLLSKRGALSGWVVDFDEITITFLAARRRFFKA